MTSKILSKGLVIYISLTDLFLIVLLSIPVILVWKNAGLRDRVLALAKQQCERQQVQLLDDTISLTKVRLKRNKHGQLVLHRYYQFEFTATGERRHRGQLTMLGIRLEDFQLEPHQLPVTRHD